MKVYLDVVLFINFFFDLLLLIGVSLLLRRNASFNKLLLAAFLGSLSILALFIKINSLQLFLLKMIISIMMCLIAFGFKDWRYTGRNLFYLYTESIVLGGGLYFLNVQFSYKQEGLVFYHNGFSINLLVLGILGPIIIYTYVKQGLHLKNHYQHYYQAQLTFPGKTFHVSAFLDTGNQLVDPYNHKPIILFYHSRDDWLQDLPFHLVPYHDTHGTGLLKCVSATLQIKGKENLENVIVGILQEPIYIDGIDCILNNKLWEE